MIEPERWASICRPTCLSDQERPGQVDVDHPLPDVVLELGQPPVARVDELNVGSAVVQGVEAAEPRDRVRDERSTSSADVTST